MEDIEIARNTKLEAITEIAKKAGIEDEELEQYGKYKAKIDNKKLFKRLQNKKYGKLTVKEYLGNKEYRCECCYKTAFVQSPYLQSFK